MNSEQSSTPQEFHVPEGVGPFYEQGETDQNENPATVEDQDQDEPVVDDPPYEVPVPTPSPHLSTSGMETPDLTKMSRQDIIDMPGLSRRQRRRLLRRAATLRKDRS